MTERPTTWTSHYAKVPKHHVDRDCRGLEHIPYDPSQHTWPSHLGLLRCDRGRPCRHCALERSVTAAAQGRWLWQGPRCNVTLSGQGRPGEPLSYTQDRYHYDEVSDSGAARLVRLARVLGLDVADTAAGPVATGALTRRWAAVLARNLRCYDLGDEVLDGPTAVETFWSLACARPFEEGAPLGPAQTARMAAAIWA